MKRTAMNTAIMVILATFLTIGATASQVCAVERSSASTLVASPAQRTTVYHGGSGSVFDTRPRFLGISNNGFTYLDRIKWRRWKGTYARGRGILQLRFGSQNGLPVLRRYRAAIFAGNPVDGHFTRLVARFREGHTVRVITWALAWNGDCWSWL